MNGDIEAVCESGLSNDGFPVEFFKAVVEERASEKTEKEALVLVMGKYCRMLACGMILGAICVVQYDLVEQNLGFLPPT